MATQADMKARIASEIARSDLTTQIAAAIATAISEYQKERFRFSQSTLVASPTFNTVIGQSTYTSAANANIGTVKKIDILSYSQGSGTTFEIYRRDDTEIKLANQGGQVRGPPDEFTYAGDAITLYPVPDAVYPVAIDGHLLIAAPASDAEADNPWMNAAELLIRCRAKYELAKHVTRNATMAADMDPMSGETGRAFRSLKGDYNRVASKGRITAQQF